MCEEAAPAVRLTLHAHQAAALRQMRARERPAVPLPHPTQRLLPAPPSAGALLADCATGSLGIGDVPPVCDTRGGFCCDEPGLGKTITSLALITKSLGLLPEAPEGAAAQRALFSFLDPHTGTERTICGAAYSDAAAPSRPVQQRARVSLRSTVPDEPPAKAARVTKVDAADDDAAAAAVGAAAHGGDATPLSGATLIVVPAPLVQHWLTQIVAHVAPGTLRVFCLLDAKAAGISAARLAWDYDVVLTTFSHLSAAAPTTHFKAMLTGNSKAQHVTLRIHWLRVMLDEGHILGSAAITARLTMACALRAERRWLLTGTPTPNTPSAQVAALRPLLEFLQVQPYCLSLIHI